MTTYNKSQLKKILQSFVTYSDSIRIFKDQIQADDKNLCFVYFTSPSKSIIKNRFNDVCLGFLKSDSMKKFKKFFNRRHYAVYFTY